MTERIRVVASDFDGTILKNGAQEVDEIYFPLIRSLKARGISFIAASGRQYGNLRRLLAPVADEISFICENGALVAQGRRILSINEIERGLVERNDFRYGKGRRGGMSDFLCGYVLCGSGGSGICGLI